MQVQKINSRVYQNQSLDKSAPNFKAKLDPRIIEAVGKDGNKLSRFLTYAGENQGEVLNILVTAFGTAIVCPLFIRYNPFSKEDNQTKAYSAWRQPISAIIAVAAQLSITKWFNNWLAKQASTSDKNGEAHIKRADLRACPHERSLRKIVKERHPEWNSKQIEEGIKELQMDAEKEVVAAAREKMKNTPIETRNLLCQEYLDNAEKDIIKDIRKEHSKHMTEKLDAFSQKIKTSLSETDFEKYKQLEEQLREWIPEPYKKEYTKIEKQMLDLLPDNFKKELKDIGSEVNITPGKFNKIVNAKFMAMAENAGVDKTEILRQRAEKMVERDVNAEAVIKYAIRKLKAKHQSIEKAIDDCTVENVLEFIRKQNLTDKLGGEQGVEEIANEVIRKLNIQKNYESAKKIKDFASTKHLGETFEEILHNVKVKKLIKSRTSDAKKVFKTTNTQLGLVVTLATLPLTCGILNWSYPRIMEKIMPEMSANKNADAEKQKTEGGKK